VVAAYGLILPQWVLDLPRLGCLNIHASLLPRWRGAAPIHRAIEAGDTETGVTLMQMDAGLDTGDMLLAQRLPIEPDDTTARLHDRLAELGARLIVQALAQAQAAPLARQPQPAEGVTYAHKIDKREAAIDWRVPAAEIERRIRAFDPFPGALAQLDGEALKIGAARLAPATADGRGAEPGTVLAVLPDALRVATGQGAIDLLQLQRAGGRRLAAVDFLRGFDAKAGMRFETPPAA
jgi:methionyl-tRNA formyltransferase